MVLGGLCLSAGLNLGSIPMAGLHAGKLRKWHLSNTSLENLLLPMRKDVMLLQAEAWNGLGWLNVMILCFHISEKCPGLLTFPRRLSHVEQMHTPAVYQSTPAVLQMRAWMRSAVEVPVVCLSFNDWLCSNSWSDTLREYSEIPPKSDKKGWQLNVRKL